MYNSIQLEMLLEFRPIIPQKQLPTADNLPHLRGKDTHQHHQCSQYSNMFRITSNTRFYVQFIWKLELKIKQPTKWSSYPLKGVTKMPSRKQNLLQLVHCFVPIGQIGCIGPIAMTYVLVSPFSYILEPRFHQNYMTNKLEKHFHPFNLYKNFCLFQYKNLLFFFFFFIYPLIKILCIRLSILYYILLKY